MELEFHQIDVRYERLRVRQPARERRLLASLAEAGQQIPIVVVATGAAYVVVDGHKRVRCLQRLQRDTVAAVIWEMAEPEGADLSAVAAHRRDGQRARTAGAGCCARCMRTTAWRSTRWRGGSIAA